MSYFFKSYFYRRDNLFGYPEILLYSIRLDLVFLTIPFFPLTVIAQSCLELTTGGITTVILRVRFLVATVKLGIKELLNKEQIRFKELFSDYQPFYTINPLLNKKLLPIQEMPKLGICEHEIVKISNKKGTLEIFWTNIGILQYKESSKFVIHALYENFLESNL